MSNVGFVLEYDDAKERVLVDSPPDQLMISEVTPVTPRSLASFRPRYHFADSVVKISDLRDFVERVKEQDGASDVRNIAYVEFEPPVTGPGLVEHLVESPSQVFMTVRAEGPAYLVISITPHKYWRATIDGSPAQLHVTNVGYQGLMVPAGRHRIELVYRNPLIMAGGVISILAILALLITLLVSRGRAETSRAAA